MSNIETFDETRENAILVGVNLGDIDDFDMYMEEFKNLSEACSMKVVSIMVQNLEHENNSFYIGPGKLEELQTDVINLEADIVIFAGQLSPSQIRNIQRELKVPVMDRTSLILEIFSKRAMTREAVLQVEVAKLTYSLPRLVGLHDALSRQGGASGAMSNKGAGEKKIELDRRYLEKRLSALKHELKEVEANRCIQRKKRTENKIFTVGLVGYTNAGKSTLMNAFLEKSYSNSDKREEKSVFEKNMLFATLDTTVRCIDNKGDIPFLLIDTVGFVSHLPHNLVDAFKSTLEEVTLCDLLLFVIDFSDVNHEEQIEVTESVLKDLGASTIPRIYVYNKADCMFDDSELPKRKGSNCIYISASKRLGISELSEMIQNSIRSGMILFDETVSFSDGKRYSFLKSNGQILIEETTEDGIHLKGYISKEKYS